MKLNANPIYRTLDRLWQLIIKERARWRCELCGAGDKGLHAAHINGRGDYWTRWDERNGLAVCPDCHDDVKIKAWLKKTDPERLQWVIEQRAKCHPGERIDLKAIQRNLEFRI